MNELPERLPSRPLRNWLLAWHIHTGDPAEVIAKGFDLDPAVVTDFLTGEVSLMLTGDALTEALRVVRRLRIDAGRLWPQVDGLRAGETDGFEPGLDRLLGQLS